MFLVYPLPEPIHAFSNVGSSMVVAIMHQVLVMTISEIFSHIPETDKFQVHNFEY